MICLRRSRRKTQDTANCPSADTQAEGTCQSDTSGHCKGGKTMSKKIYFTLTGTNYYHGMDFLKEGMKVKLIKEPDNPYDAEAIRVEMEPLQKIGYVANSTKTVIGESWSAGRMYDRIGKKADAVVKLVTESGVLCKVCKKSVRN